MDKMGHNVEVRISNVSIHGFPATGKTSVIRLAMGQPPVLHHDSTGVAEPPSCSIIVGDNVKWEELTPERMLDMVCKTIEDLPEPVATNLVEPIATKSTVLQHEVEPTSDARSLSITSTPSSFAPSSHQTSSEQSATSPSSHPSFLPHSPSISRPSNRHSPSRPSSRSSPVPTPEAKRERDIPQVMKDIMQRLPNVTESSTLFSTRLILMSDSGGQPNYLDVFPLFVHSRCLALFTLKLNERLDAIPNFSFCIGDKPINMANTMFQCSHLQLLESLAKSMSPFLPSLSPLSPSDDHTAKFTIIGTFVDKAEECRDESIDDKNASLAQNLKDYEKLKMGETILAINAVTTDEKQRDEYILKLRERIEEAPSTKVTIKLRWFGFYLQLQNEVEQLRDILLLQECVDIGSSLGMDEQETMKAIKFFHNLNLILHYQTKSLGSIIIINLKPVFNLVSCLIGISCFKDNELSKYFNIDLNYLARRDFQKYGQINEQALKESKLKFPKPLDAAAFVDLLAEVKAVAIIEKSKPRSFFMPCVLNSTQSEEYKIKKELTHPLILRLRSKRTPIHDYVPLPPGFSPTLIVFLLSSDKFNIDPNVQQYRNIFVLRRTGNNASVTIIERRVQLEIYYSFDGYDDREWYYIRHNVCVAICNVKKTLGFDEESIYIEDSFPCSCNPPLPNSRHIPCEPAPGQPICRANCIKIDKPCGFMRQELRWLSLGNVSRTYNECYVSDIVL